MVTMLLMLLAQPVEAKCVYDVYTGECRPVTEPLWAPIQRRREEIRRGMRYEAGAYLWDDRRQRRLAPDWDDDLSDDWLEW